MNNQSYLVFDIETIPDVLGLRLLNSFDAELSDEEVVELARAQRIEQVGNDFFPLHLQRVVAISIVYRGGSNFVVKSLGREDSTEAELIQLFFQGVERSVPTIVSWNGSGFDFPVLHYRSLIHKICAPTYWDTTSMERQNGRESFKFNNYHNRYHNRHTDLMDVLASYFGRASAPLDQLAKLCGFPGKMGMDGAQVWSAYADGKLAEIRHYCETDVLNTWLVYLRYLLITGTLIQEDYDAEIELVKSSLVQLAKPHWHEYLSLWNS